MHPEFIKSQFIHNKRIAIIFPGTSGTKLTGQYPVLGLHLSYDIVKEHGGEKKVESEIAEGTEFKISLPVIQSYE